MANTPNHTEPNPPREQMDRPQDPEARAAMDRDAGKLAMESEHHAFAGAAQGVGSVEYDEAGAYDVGAGSAPQAIRGDQAAIGGESWDLGDDADRDRVRAGGLAPGQPEPRDDAGEALAREAAVHEAEMRDVQGPRPEGGAPPAGAPRTPPDQPA